MAKYTKDQFPSPCGEKVGINEADKPLAEVLQPKFPSPCGEKVGINTGSRLEASTVMSVSVPLRGKGRDQHGLVTNLLDQAYAAGFPSPCGEKVGINPTPGKA